MWGCRLYSGMLTRSTGCVSAPLLFELREGKRFQTIVTRTLGGSSVAHGCHGKSIAQTDGRVAQWYSYAVENKKMLVFLWFRLKYS